MGASRKRQAVLSCFAVGLLWTISGVLSHNHAPSVHQTPRPPFNGDKGLSEAANTSQGVTNDTLWAFFRPGPVTSPNVLRKVTNTDEMQILNKNDKTTNIEKGDEEFHEANEDNIEHLDEDKELESKVKLEELTHEALMLPNKKEVTEQEMSKDKQKKELKTREPVAMKPADDPTRIFYCNCYCKTGGG